MGLCRSQFRITIYGAEIQKNTQENVIKNLPIIPDWLIWIQCIAFIVLYAVWILPEIVGFRNTSLVVGAIAGLYPIYQFRHELITKRAIPLLLIVGLFAWATFHLLFLSHDYAAQLLEYKRIWKYAALGAIFGFGLGLSLANSGRHRVLYWLFIYFGLIVPVVIYLIKYVLTKYVIELGISVPPALKLQLSSEPFYIPKSDYVAFCVPVFAVSLANIQLCIFSHKFTKLTKSICLLTTSLVIISILFLFNIQNIKNGFVYAAVLCSLFVIWFCLFGSSGKMFTKILIVAFILLTLLTGLTMHLQKNTSWDHFFADSKIGFQIEKYQQWKYAGEQGYPNNESGRMVSVSSYERAAWIKVGLMLSANDPLGYGLIEDSFKRMVRVRWPEASPNLSHSHSGWLDLLLGIGLPGVVCILTALILGMLSSRQINQPWKNLVFWGLIANLLLWVTTEVSATVTFSALIFWITFSAGLCTRGQNEIITKAF